MKELEAIVYEAERARVSGKAAALAIVVSIDGSAYRLPGARMLIVDGKWVAGSISGGCLEDDVVLRAGEAIARNEALVTTYDTTSDDDIVFGVGLGCKGVITILIEPIRAPDRAVDFVGFARSCLQDRTVGIAATVIRTEAPEAAKPGSRMLLRDRLVVSDIADADLADRIRSEAQLQSGESSRVITIALEHGSADVFVERVEPPTPLVVFGAGHDAMPVVQLAKELGWHVTVIDHRPAYGNAARFPLADRVVVCTPKDVASQVTLEDDTLALLMTHREIIPAPVVEVTDTGEAHAVTVDDRPRHHGDLRPPVAIVRRGNSDPPRDDGEKQHGHAD